MIESHIKLKWLVREKSSIPIPRCGSTLLGKPKMKFRGKLLEIIADPNIH